MAKRLKYNATLIERIDLEPTLAVFVVGPDDPPPPGENGASFVPGQYVTIGLNRDEAMTLEGMASNAPESVRRAMSIASAPEDHQIYEFYIRFVERPESDLPLTHVMWPIQAGDRLFCRTKATGKFTIPHTVGDDDRRLKLMVAAGTGLAPFICMARSRIKQDPAARLDDFAVLHGASYASSLGYRQELEGLAANNGLRYLPTISRPQSEPDWPGAAGRVEALLTPERIGETERALGLDPGFLAPEHTAVYICGLQGTIANTITSLLPRGYVPDNRRIRRSLKISDDRKADIFWEQYDTLPVIDLKDDALMEELRQVVADAA